MFKRELWEEMGGLTHKKEIKMHVTSIRVVAHRRSEAGYVEYTLSVQGQTPCMHLTVSWDRETDFYVNSRFSQLAEVHRELEVEYSGLPPFPPKKWLRNKTEEFIEQRQEQLNGYFEVLLEREELRSSAVWTTVFAPRKTLGIAVVGTPGIGKMRVVEGFLNCCQDTRLQPLTSLVENGRASELGQVCPIDLVVHKTLVRLRALTMLQYTSEAHLSAMRLLSGFDGVVIVHSQAKPDSHDSVSLLSTHLIQPSVLVGLDCISGVEGAGVSLHTVEDCYKAFYQLMERL